MKFPNLTVADNLKSTPTPQIEDGTPRLSDFGAGEYYGATAFRVLWEMVWALLDASKEEKAAVVRHILQKAHGEILRTVKIEVDKHDFPDAVKSELMSQALEESAQIAQTYQTDLMKNEFNSLLRACLTDMLRRTVQKGAPNGKIPT